MKTFKKTELTTLVKVTNNLLKEGYTENFLAKDYGIVAPSKNNKVYKPEEVKITSFYRFEGESDPADNSVVYAIETNDGVKGQLVDAYGVYANPLIGKFIVEVEEIGKRDHENEVPIEI